MPLLNPNPLQFARLWWAIGWLGLALLTWVCLTPTPPSGPSLPYIDKIVHFFSYLILGFWFSQLRSQSKWQVLLGLSLYGLWIEVLQEWGGVRHFEWMDWAADTLGAWFAVMLCRSPLGRLLSHLDRRLRKT